MMNSKAFSIYLCLFIVFLGYISAAIAQSKPGNEADTNLIKNGSFENVEGKLKKLGQFYNVSDWFTPTKARADIFSSRGEIEDIKTPFNAKGKSNPSDGDNYAGITFFSYQGREDRSYLSTELNGHLEKGKRYCIKYDISLAESSKYAVNNIGVYFSKKKIEEDQAISIVEADRVVSNDNRVFEEMGTWEPICIPFTSLGFEKFLAIGNFASDNDIEYKKLDKPSWIDIPQEQVAYYYIDNVQLFGIERDVECDCKREEEKIPNIIFSKSAVFNERASLKDKLSYATCYFYMLRTDLPNAAVKDLDRVAELLKENPRVSLIIEGNSDNKEQEMANLNDNYENISTARAEAVKDYLVDKGIGASRLVAKSYKNENPATTMETPLSLAKNRRVELKIQ